MGAALARGGSTGGLRPTQIEDGPTQSDFREQARSESESLSSSVLEI